MRSRHVSESTGLVSAQNKFNSVRYFEKILSGMSMQDLSFVANLDSLAADVRMHNADKRELVNISDILPWSLKFTMIRYRYKHPFENQGPPSRQRFLRNL